MFPIFLFLLNVNNFAQYIDNQNCNIFADEAMIYSFGWDIPDKSRQGSIPQIYIGSLLEHKICYGVDRVKLLRYSNLAVSLNGDRLGQFCFTEWIGVTADSKLLWENHCDNLCCKLFSW